MPCGRCHVTLQFLVSSTKRRTEPRALFRWGAKRLYRRRTKLRLGKGLACKVAFAGEAGALRIAERRDDDLTAAALASRRSYSPLGVPPLMLHAAANHL